MFINALMVTYTTLKSTKNTDKYIEKRVNEFLVHYEQNREKVVEIKLNHMGLQGVLYNLDDLGIENYIVNQEILIKKEGYFFGY